MALRASARQSRTSRRVPEHCEEMRLSAIARDALCRKRQRLLSSKNTARLENPRHRISEKRSVGWGGGCASGSRVVLTTPRTVSVEPSTAVSGPREGVGEGKGAVHADRVGVGVEVGVGVGAEVEES